MVILPRLKRAFYRTFFPRPFGGAQLTQAPAQGGFAQPLTPGAPFAHPGETPPATTTLLCRAHPPSGGSPNIFPGTGFPRATGILFNPWGPFLAQHLFFPPRDPLVPPATTLLLWGACRPFLRGDSLRGLNHGRCLSRPRGFCSRFRPLPGFPGRANCFGGPSSAPAGKRAAATPLGVRPPGFHSQTTPPLAVAAGPPSSLGAAGSPLSHARTTAPQRCGFAPLQWSLAGGPL